MEYNIGYDKAALLHTCSYWVEFLMTSTKIVLAICANF